MHYHRETHAPSPMCLFPLRTELLDQLFYGILPIGSTSSRPIKASLVERQFHGCTACAADQRWLGNEPQAVTVHPTARP